MNTASGWSGTVVSNGNGIAGLISGTEKVND